MLHTLHSTLCTLVCLLEMPDPLPVHPTVPPAVFCLEERSSLPNSQQSSDNNSSFRRDEGCTCRATSPPLITRTWEQLRASGPSRIFYPACLRSCQCRDRAGEILSSEGSWDGPAEWLGQGHSCGSGRCQMFPRQLAEVGHTVTFAVDLGAKGSGLMVSKSTSSHQEAPGDATVVAPLQLVGKQIFCQLSHCFSDPGISIC